MTQKLISVHQRMALMNGYLNVAIKTKNGGYIWVGDYCFNFYVKFMLANQSDKAGHKWDSLQLEIVDGSEDIGLPE